MCARTHLHLRKSIREIKNRFEIRYEDVDLQNLKNIAEPVRVYQISVSETPASKTVRSVTKLRRTAAVGLLVVLVATLSTLFFGLGTEWWTDRNLSKDDTCPDISGSWHWFNGGTIPINSNGTLGKEQGTWTCSSGNFVLKWSKGYTDQLRLSADHNFLSGYKRCWREGLGGSERSGCSADSTGECSCSAIASG